MKTVDRAADVIIIGGGLHGCSTALHLAWAGYRALLLEKDYVGRHASVVNAGGVRRLGRHVAEIPLAEASLAIWRNLSDLVADNCGFKVSGQVKVAENEADMARLIARVNELEALGFFHEVLLDRPRCLSCCPVSTPRAPGGCAVKETATHNPIEA